MILRFDLAFRPLDSETLQSHVVRERSSLHKARHISKRRKA